MKRLTIKAPSGLIHLKDSEEMTVNAAIKKLSDYEDLEEQGLLLKLPCKVGTKVYCIMTSIKGTHPMIFTQSFDYSMIECFGKAVFLTQAEAEEALKGMEGENETD